MSIETLTNAIENFFGEEREKRDIEKLAEDSRILAEEILNKRASIEIAGKKFDIYLERSSRPDGDSPKGEVIMRFEEADQLPYNKISKVLYWFDVYSSVFSSHEGKLKTPAQFAKLNSVLESIKTFPKPSSVPAKFSTGKTS